MTCFNVSLLTCLCQAFKSSHTLLVVIYFCYKPVLLLCKSHSQLLTLIYITPSGAYRLIQRG